MENLIGLLINSDNIVIPFVIYLLVRQEKLLKRLNKFELEISQIKAKVCKKWYVQYVVKIKVPGVGFVHTFLKKSLFVMIAIIFPLV